jgi:hypothetical protein
MSHHHVLPPLLEFLPVKPKKIENRRRRRVLVSSDGTIKDAGEAEEVDEMLDVGLSPLFQPLPGEAAPVERSKRRARSTTGKLSDGTLKLLLLAQEQIK